MRQNRTVEFRSEERPSTLVRLWFEPDPTDVDLGHIVVEARGDGLVVDHSAFAVTPHDLHRFLSNLVANWRGWDGARTWHTLDDDLRIEATHQGRLVELLFIVRCDDRPGAWEARLPILVTPGESLNSLADSAALLLG